MLTPHTSPASSSSAGLVVVSLATSADGYLDDTSPERLLISGPRDFAAVQHLRAWSDAIVVGAGTVRRDRPSLTIREPAARQARAAHSGTCEPPARVVIAGDGDLPRDAHVFQEGAARVLVFAPAHRVPAIRHGLGTHISVHGYQPAAPPQVITEVRDALLSFGVSRLLVEPGVRSLDPWLTSGCVDVTRWAKHRTMHVGEGPWHLPSQVFEELEATGRNPNSHLFSLEDMSITLTPRTRQGGDWLRLARKNPDLFALNHDVTGTTPGQPERHWMDEALAEAAKAPVTAGRYRVGAVLVAEGRVIGRGHTGAGESVLHAEQVAFNQATDHGQRSLPPGTTLVSTMEPCTHRVSHPETCTQATIRLGCHKVVFAAREPLGLATCQGFDSLVNAGVAVEHWSDWAPQVWELNSHLLRT